MARTIKNRLILNTGLVLWSALIVSGCSSTEETAEPEVETSDEDAAKADDDEGGGKNATDGNEAKEVKQPISDDGYDDDWNNMGTQQQKQNNQAKNNEKPAENDATNSDALNAEPALANQPAVNQAQVPAEEPPLDNEPAPVPEQVVMNTQAIPEPVPEPVVAPAPPATLASGAPLLKSDVMPQTSSLTWLGYDFIERDSVIRIEMVTRGSPKFNIFQERNQANQPELVVRFFQTALRDKVRRDIDASEFRSPVAYVRMRYDEAENSVDVIMTMRDIVQPRLYSKYGNVLLTFAIPDHYFGNSTVGRAPVAKAEMLPNTNVMPEIDAGSDLPEGVKIAKAFISDPGAVAFKDAPEDGGEPVEAEPLPENVTSEALPADFNNLPEDEPLNGGNIATSTVGSNTGEGDELFGENIGANGGGEELNGENLSGENFNFDADAQSEAGGLNSAPAPSANAAAAAQAQQVQSEGLQPAAEETEDEENEQEEDEDYEGDDELEDGGTEEEINKFDVRLRRLRAPSTILAVAMSMLIEMPFTATAVGQDNLEQEAPAQNANAANEGDLGNASLDGQTPEQGEANFGAEEGLGDNGDFLGEGGEDPNAFGNTGNGTNLGNDGFSNPVNNTGNTGNAKAGANAFSNAGNAPVNNSAPVNNVVPINNANAAAAGEPALEGSPDLAGVEQEGSDTDAAPTPSAGGRPIKLDFRGAPLTEVIRALGDESRVNFVFPPDVGAKQIWINLQGVPFNDALRAVLESNALGMLEMGPNLVRIDTLERIAKDKEDEERRRKAELKLRPTKVLVHRMSFSKAEEAAKMLEPMLAAAKAEDPRVTVQFDVRTNSVIVNAPPGQLAMVKSLLERIDLETPQVKIASRVVEVIKSAAEDFGISWFPKLNFDQGRGLGFGNLTFPNSMVSRYSVDAGGSTPSTGNMQFTFGSINDSIALDLALSMQESMGTSEVLQTSNVVVEDNTKAEVLAGSTDFFQIPAARAGDAPTVVEVKYNLAMNVTPHVTADGSVKLNIELSSDDPAKLSPGALASKNNRLLKTSMIRRSGETAVIGGVISNTASELKAGVPYLSSIPIIGALFRSSNSEEKKRELMVMVTPTIVGLSKGGEFAGAETVSNVAANTGNFGNDNTGGNFDGGDDDSLDGAQTQNQGGNNNFQAESQNNGQQQATQQNNAAETQNAQENAAAAQNQQGAEEADAEVEEE